MLIATRNRFNIVTISADPLERPDSNHVASTDTFMQRRNFLAGLPLLGIGIPKDLSHSTSLTAAEERKYWVDTLIKISKPVLQALSDNALKDKMPVESAPGEIEGRRKVTYLEALGRTLAGLSPWLSLGATNNAEGKLREQYIDMSLKAIRNAVTPGSVNFMNFTEASQPLVDAAFLAHALLRAPGQLWERLDETTQQHLINALLSTRTIKPYYSNWLLFSAMVEAALLKFSTQYDAMRIDFAVRSHEAWYKGDGVYGDGPEFHFDYYNSYVIQPMLLDVLLTLQQEAGAKGDAYDIAMRRAQRYAEIQERMISPEGTFPPVGRSIAYRCGAFQLLAQIALQRKLPVSLRPGQVRSALTAVIRRSMEAPQTFDRDGWLRIGFCGHQPGIGETYISTGSLYLCTLAFLPLGLPESDAFWADDAEDWTSKKAYAGSDFPIDKALH
jgi:hypothetical protein